MTTAYVGNELHTFRHARRWKHYWGSHVRPWIRGDVLEVGAGIGANTLDLHTPRVTSWHCLEPDPTLAREAREALRTLGSCTVSEGVTTALKGPVYDTVLYIDVLEHIADDRAEVEHAVELLRTDGCLVVLAPAYQWLYSPFDRAVGHHRRYSRKSLQDCSVPGTRLEVVSHLDSVGVLLLLGNRWFLGRSKPTLSQVLFWDRYVVPFSRIVDPLFGRKVGKSVVAVWRKTGA